MKLSAVLILLLLFQWHEPTHPSRRGFVLIPELSDEFDGDALDKSKWYDHNDTWMGRKPGFFYPSNVEVKNGFLTLTTRVQNLPNYPTGYHTYTTAAVKSKAKVKYGYFGIKAQVGKSEASSSFWFYDNTRNYWGEIDVYELAGGDGWWVDTYNMNAPIFKIEGRRKNLSYPGGWKAPYKFTTYFNIYALEWDADWLIWYVNEKEVRRLENKWWHQELYLNIDSETMPSFFGLPDVNKLPSTYKVDWVRSWRRKE